MNIWREVGRRFVVWLLMAAATMALTLLAANPLEHMPLTELLGFLGQALLVGALLALSVSYFSVRLGDQKVSRALGGAMLLALAFFPNYVWGRLGRVFGGVEPVISSMLVMLAVSLGLNVALHLLRRGGRAGRSPR
jgi:peptidoglycan/LPS O-acetylase OafA/YrhL